MNSKRINNIFTSSGNLSRKDIDVYKETSDEKVKHAIEEKALASDFDMDALEGWNASKTGTSSMKKLDKKFMGNNISLTWILGVSAVLIVIAFFLFNNSTTKEFHASSKINTTKNTAITYEKTDIILPQAIEEMKELPKKEQIQVSTIQKDFTIQKKEETGTTQTNEKQNIPVENLPVKSIENTKIDPEIARKQLLAAEIYLEGLKLVDYRNYRSRPTVSTKAIKLNGTPASMESENSKIEELPEWETVEIPYMDYIEKSMAIFAKGNNKKALSRFEVILETYPSDINANFYGGLCYFNLREYDKAIATFEKCLNSEYINFNEEAEWYLAKSYLANGNKEKAISLFDKIEERGGYYAKQAAKY